MSFNTTPPTPISRIRQCVWRMDQAIPLLQGTLELSLMTMSLDKHVTHACKVLTPTAARNVLSIACLSPTLTG